MQLTSSLHSLKETILRDRDRVPTMYLFDEYHHCDRCTDESITAARQLFEAGVVIAGVEGYEGGRCFDVDSCTYAEKRVNGDPSESTLIGTYPRFAAALASAGYLVVGVDCRGLADQIETDMFDGIWTGTIAEHKNQRLRSEHFVRTVTEEALNRDLSGDVLLNAGAAHNDHIADVLKSGSLPAGWPDYRFVRLRCLSFEECRPTSSASGA